ncbi:MAG TPA: HPr family phosphocarrier protein, partial [Pseudomonadales bacterium]|nr:HPr family phosphocarrier protein [Pseudomonadales bacterium]
KLGLHARAASKFVNLAKRFASRIEVSNATKSVDGKSIMSIMLLAASQGTEIGLRINGEDELDAMQAITQLIADRFGEGE